MGVFDNLRGRNDAHLARASLNEKRDPNEAVDDSDGSNADTLSLEARNEKEVQAHPDIITSNAQEGVQKAEAAALVWTKSALYGTYAWIWVCMFMLAFQSSIGNNVLYKAYSAFSTAPEVSTANVLASIVGGVLKLPIAKLLNVWGRAEAFLLFVGVYLLGMIIIASCNGPNGYAAGYTLYWVGYDAIYIILDVFVADTSGLRNRAFAFAFVSTPFIATAFVGPLAAESVLTIAGWRWGYGIFCIVMPFIFVPLAVIFKFYQKKAEKLGLYKRNASGRTTVQSIVHYIHEFDVIGALILMAAFIFFLLPFSLQTNLRITYHSATFIALVVIGVLLFPTFYVWERYFARVHFIRWELFRERTVLGACVLAAVLYFSFYSWDLYFYYFCYVVYDLTIAKTGYMTQIYNVGSCFWGVVFGIYVRTTKHFKYACLCFGAPLLMLGAGLMIHFRGQDGSIGYIIMCQIFIAFGGGTLVIGNDMAVMAASDREGVPLMLSLLGLFSSLGGAIGYAVSAAIYTAKFPAALEQALPADMKADATKIYLGGYTTQVLYAVGSDTRNAIDYAWGQSQKWGSVSATVVLILAFPCIFAWKNYNVNKRQNKGTMI